jgi:hypothetical protein
MVENRAIEELIELFGKFVQVDKDVQDKELFLKIVKNILEGKSAITIAKTHKVGELVVVGVRRKLEEYKSKSQNRALALRVGALLRATKYMDTYSPNWTSPELHAMVTRKGEVPRSSSTGRNEVKVRDHLKLALTRKPK